MPIALVLPLDTLAPATASAGGLRSGKGLLDEGKTLLLDVSYGRVDVAIGYDEVARMEAVVKANVRLWDMFRDDTVCRDGTVSPRIA